MSTYTVSTPKLNWDKVRADQNGFDADIKALSEVAAGKGADMATLIEAAHVACDERVTLKCRIPPCESYGVNLMCPPFSHTATETAKYVARYKWGLLVAVKVPLTEKYWKWIQRKDVPLCKMWREKEYSDYYHEFGVVHWRKLHDIVTAVERDAHNRGYFFAVGYVAWSCYLCWKGPLESASESFGYCNTNQPCVRPYEARPSMEASGIDVFTTYANAGLNLPMASKELLTYTGLILVV